MSSPSAAVAPQKMADGNDKQFEEHLDWVRKLHYGLV
jgi:hypothetical protein